MKPPLSLLSKLWLSEPDADLLRAAVGAGFPEATVEDLALAYADLFLLNVYPYGSVFLNPSGELNGAPAAWAEQRYAAAGYAPPDLARAGGADHVGLCLGFLAHVTDRGVRDWELLDSLRAWIPVCALAIEREPAAHEFYRLLARATREQLLGAPSPQGPREGFEAEPGLSSDTESELRLSDVLQFLLTPARCGFFLSRGRAGRLASAGGAPLPFGSRFDVVRRLFERAGEEGTVEGLIALLDSERSQWRDAYEALARAHPVWAWHADRWKARLDRTGEALAAMRGIVQSPPEWEYQERES